VEKMNRFCLFRSRVQSRSRRRTGVPAFAFAQLFARCDEFLLSRDCKERYETLRLRLRCFVAQALSPAIAERSPAILGALNPRRYAARLNAILRIALTIVFLPAPVSLAAQDVKPTEYQVKAAYLANLGRFVEQWSARPRPSPDETFDLCVLGQDPFGSTLDAALKGEKIGGSPLAAKRIARPQDAPGCRVLFISSSEGDQLNEIMAALGTAPVLTVADIPDFVKRGGMVQFVLDGNHVRFEINIAASQRSGLKLSSELLKVARLVTRTP
jgi:hypothetical protein